MLQASPPRRRGGRASGNSFYPPALVALSAVTSLATSSAVTNSIPDVLAHQRRGLRRADDPPAPLDQLDRLARLAKRDEALRKRRQHPVDRLRRVLSARQSRRANDSGRSLRGGTRRSRHSLSAVTSPASAISTALRVSASASPSSSASAASVARLRTPFGFPLRLPDWPF
jgi:hypothetical protein